MASSFGANDSAVGIKIKIADIGLVATTVDPSIDFRAVGAMERFVVEDVEPTVRLQARRCALDEAESGTLVFDSGSLWRLFREDRDYLFRFVSPVCGRAPYQIARLNEDFTFGEILLNSQYVSENIALDPIGYPLDEIIYVNLLARGRGVEMHSCSLVTPSGKGYIFAGHSGIGKTTTARLWEPRSGVQILTDDRTIIRQSADGFWLYGTPWHGEGRYALPQKAKLNAIFLLSQATHNELVEIAPADAVAKLFTCQFPTFYYPEGLAFTLAFNEEMVQSVPCYEYRFVADDSAVQFLMDRLG